MTSDAAIDIPENNSDRDDHAPQFFCHIHGYAAIPVAGLGFYPNNALDRSVGVDVPGRKVYSWTVREFNWRRAEP